MSALILPRISAYGARVGLERARWPHLEGLPLADPDPKSSGSIDLLLGADVYSSIIEDGLRKGGAGVPMAQKTSLGWLVSGVIDGTESRAAVASLQCSVDKELPMLVRRFWEQEEPTHPPLPLTEEEQKCEEFFVRTHSRLASGRYVVRLPIKLTLPDLFGSRKVALRVLQGVERKGKNDPKLSGLYTEFMREYEELGHMSRVTTFSGDRTTRLCYLPHHGVLKRSDDSVKIRVVFNGSARLHSGDSLNAHLFTGPNLLPALTDVLLKWRFHRYVIVAEIEKMYRQISLHPCDRDLQRILWRSRADATVLEYQLNTVMYGLTCAPFLAIRTLRHLASDDGHTCPRAAAILQEETYVDDILTGADTETEARMIAGELTALCAAGGFPLRKWAANEATLLDDIPPEHRQLSDLHLWRPEIGHATLGLQWHPQEDAFIFKVQPVTITSVTKRTVLSHTARLFDPLGWLVSIVVRAKTLIQSA